MKIDKTIEYLRESETRLHELFENMNHCAAVYRTTDGENFYLSNINRAAEQLEKISRQDILGKNVADVFPDILKFGLLEVFRRVWQSGVPENFPAFFYHDGHVSSWRDNYVYKLPSGEIVAIYDDADECWRLVEAIQRERNFANSLIDTAQAIVLVLDTQARIVRFNPFMEFISGYTLHEVQGKDWFDAFIPRDGQENIRAVFLKVVNGNQILENVNPILTKDGEERLIEWHSKTLKSIDGDTLGILSVGQDVTERKQAEQALVESRERLRLILSNALDAVVQMDEGGIITDWSGQAEKIFGWTHAEAVGRMMHETIMPPQYRNAHLQGMKHFLETGEGEIINSRVELHAVHRDGHDFPIELSVASIKAGGRHIFNAFIRDISDRKRSEEMIWKQANYDVLTGMPNRHMFYDRLAQEIKKAKRAGYSIALLFIDLDRFKEVNDTLGHTMGDMLLVEVSHRINGLLRETDTLSRLSGDEFIIILTELHDISRIEVLSQDILDKLAEPFRLESDVTHVTASIGITLYPRDTTKIEELLQNADQAMYAAKKDGRNRFSYFTPSMQQVAQEQLRLTTYLRGALAAGQFRTYYQPIVDMVTGRIYKAEALLRWVHPVRGLVGPVEFISRAEETGLIVEIGDWVFKEAARQVKIWQALYDSTFQISVNKSPVQFFSVGKSSQLWAKYLHDQGVSGQSMVIEITEGLLLEAENGVKDRLLQFHNAGIQISLDDFGTGYSSLSYLQKFDIDYLKIDQSFIRKLSAGSSNMALPEAIIVMAHKLGLKVIAEGVETAEQRDLLVNMGCDYAQGYLYSKPVPADEFELLLTTGVSRF